MLRIILYIPLVTIAFCLLCTQAFAAGGGGPRFLENRGQLRDTEGQPRPEIAFIADIDGVRRYYSSTGFSVVFVEDVSASESGPTGADPIEMHGARWRGNNMHHRNAWRLDVSFVNANPDVRILPADETPTRTRYITAGMTDGPVLAHGYRRIRYENLWDRIDADFILRDGSYKYEFTVHPGGRPEDIRFRFVGAESMFVDISGRLHVTTPLGGYIEDAPVSFQRVSGGELPVESFFLIDGQELRFGLGEWNPSETLVIDPWATYFGGSGIEDGLGVVVDGDGNVTASGSTWSADFPVVRAQYTSLSGTTDAYLLRLRSDGSVRWATYYGGSGHETPYSIADDADGNILVCGWTNSADLPVRNPMQAQTGGGWDAFVAKFDSSGALVWATYAGGSGDDYGNDIAVDMDGNVHVVGQTVSTNFPLRNPAQSVAGGNNDAFIMKLDSAGTVLWSTIYGGSEDEYAFGIAPRRDGMVFVGGYTASDDFPTLNPWQDTLSGTSDMFLLALDSSGTPLWSGYFGGSSSEMLTRLRVDPDGNAVISGWSRSSDFPLINASQSTYGGGATDGVVAKFDSSGAPLWSTFFGGSGSDGIYGLAVDQNATIAVTGGTSSTDLPTKHAHQVSKGAQSDAFIAVFDSSGALLWGTYYGGSGNDGGNGIAFDAIGGVVMTGYTYSSDLPVYNAVQQQLSGASDAMLLSFTSNGFIPVELLAFTGRLHNGSVHLAWQTVREAQNLGFEVQRSNDGTVWERLGFVSGGGNSTSLRYYQFTDRLETSEIARDLAYRLRQIDFDGSVTYSPVLHISAGAAFPRADILSVYPSPASTDVTVVYTNGMSEATTIVLHDALGRELYRHESHNALQGAQVLILPTAGFPAGSYLLSLMDGVRYKQRLLRVLR